MRNPFSTPIGILLSVLSIVVLLSVFVVSVKRPSSVHEGFDEITVYRVKEFMQDGCGHCKAIEPTMNKFAADVTRVLSSGDGKSCGVKVEFEVLKPPTHRSEYTKYNISGTPTIILTKDDGTTISEMSNTSNVTCEKLVNWMTTNIDCPALRSVCTA